MKKNNSQWICYLMIIREYDKQNEYAEHIDLYKHTVMTNCHYATHIWWHVLFFEVPTFGWFCIYFIQL